MKKTNITLSIALAAVFSASTAFAEAEVTGKIVHESGFFSEAGTTIGDWGVSTHANLGLATQGMSTTTTPSHSKNDAMKRETSARIYVDGELNEVTDGATYHVELNLMTDGKGNSNYDSHESYTQRDALREAYVDSQVGDWSLRTGKQQVVWGTADGMKLLDMINPTDYGEMAQNQMEDSRIPVWMVNAETTNADGSELQVIVSQPRENVFAGLNRHTDTSVRKNTFGGTAEDTTLNNGTDTGHAFVMKGPDTITGVHYGFLNIAPDLGGVAARFAGGFGGVGTLATAGMNGFVLGGTGNGHFEPMTMKVMAYSMQAANAGAPVGALLDAETSGGDYTDLPGTAGTLFEGAITGAANFFAGGTATTLQKNNLTGQQLLKAGFASQYDTNLADLTTEATEADSTAFDYMGNTTFMTFDAFVNAGSQYVYDMPENSEIDLATRYKNSTADGVNYSLNASYNYDKNPIIDLSWRNSAGAKLAVNKMVYEAGTGMKVDSSATSNYTLMLTDAVKADNTVLANGEYGGLEKMVEKLPISAHRYYIDGVLCLSKTVKYEGYFSQKCLSKLKMARESDALKVRIIPEINKFIRQFKHKNVIVIDPVKDFLSKIVDLNEYRSNFIDFQHPSQLGHALIAENILNEVLLFDQNSRHYSKEFCGISWHENGKLQYSELQYNECVNNYENNINWLNNLVKYQPTTYQYNYYKTKAEEELKKLKFLYNSTNRVH